MQSTTPGCEPARKARQCRLLTAAILSFLALGATSGLLAATMEALLPARHEALFPEKLALVTSGPGYEMAFVGSSRVHRHVNPGRVKRAISEAPSGWEAVNLGVPGLTVLEQFEVVETWLKRLPKPPRHVVLEPVLNASLEADNLDSERVIRFHRPDDMAFLLRFIAGSSMMPRRKALYSVRHIVAFGYYWLNYGKVAALVRPPLVQSYLDPSLHGFMPLGDGLDPALGPRASSILEPRFLRNRVDEAVQAHESQTLTPTEAHVIGRLVDAVRRLGASPVLFLPPRLEWDRRGGRTVLDLTMGPAVREALASNLPDVPLLDYTNPREFPEFYQAELWYDATHLGTTGANLFSQRLGSDLARIVQAR